MSDKPISDKKLAANRANAQKSTGPRTPEGKARSRLNAVRHGLVTDHVVMHDDPHENWDEFRDMRNRLQYDLNPGDLLEEIIIDRIANCFWRIRRAHRFEAQSIFHYKDRYEVLHPEPDDSRRHPYKTMPDPIDLNTLIRYESLIDREVNRLMKQLAQLQDARRKARQDAESQNEPCITDAASRPPLPRGDHRGVGDDGNSMTYDAPASEAPAQNEPIYEADIVKPSVQEYPGDVSAHSLRRRLRSICPSQPSPRGVVHLSPAHSLSLRWREIRHRTILLRFASVRPTGRKALNHLFGIVAIRNVTIKQAFKGRRHSHRTRSMMGSPSGFVSGSSSKSSRPPVLGSTLLPGSDSLTPPSDIAVRSGASL